MVIRVADEEPLPDCIDRQLAGVTQRGVDALLVLLRRHRDGVVPETLFRVKRERGGDAGVDHLLVAFAGDEQQQVAPWADDGHRRPTPDTDLLPHLHRVVVHDRVGDLVAQHGVADVRRHLFVFELGRVHADKRDRITGVPFLQLGEVGQHVDAVDAAVGPEIEHDNLAGELPVERKRRRVEPIFAIGERRRAESFGLLVHPLDMGLELLEQPGELRAARRQVGRLARRGESGQGEGERGQLGQAEERGAKGLAHGLKLPLAGRGCKSGLGVSAWPSDHDARQTDSEFGGDAWPSPWRRSTGCGSARLGDQTPGGGGGEPPPGRGDVTFAGDDLFEVK